MRISTKLPTLFLLLSVLLLAALALGTALASAETLSPWWHLASRTRPSYLQPGQAKDTVQDVTVSGSPGENVTLAYVVPKSQGEVVRSAEFPVGAEASVVQTSLEGALGSNNVEVAGGPEAMVGIEPYVVTFTGALTDQSVEPLSTEFSAARVSVKVVAVGRPDGYIVVNAANLGTTYANPCVHVGSGGKFKDSGCTEAAEPGAEEFEQKPVTLTDKLPPGLEAVGIEGTVEDWQGTEGHPYELECALGSLSCSFTGTTPSSELGSLGKYPHSVAPFRALQMSIAVRLKEAGAQAAKSGEENVAGIVGGDAPAATTRQKLVVSGAPLPFGAASYEISPEESGGGIDTGAGSHPFQLTTTLALNETLEGTAGKPTALVKDQHFKLPPGLIGNPIPFPQCPLATFLSSYEECSAQTVVGVSRVEFRAYILGRFSTLYPATQAVYNLEPAVGEPARFGFIVEGAEGVHVLLNTAVRTGGDYGVTVSTVNVTQLAELANSEVTFWGVPGDARHDRSRGKPCLRGAIAFSMEGSEPGTYKCPAFEGESHPPPLLTLPTSCANNPLTGEPEPLHSEYEGDSWAALGKPSEKQEPLLNTAPMPALDGCNRLPFAPEIKVSPDGQQASKPTGLTVDVHVPQEGQLNPEGLAQSNVKNIVVTLPDGVILNPSAADGLEGCSAHLIGYEDPREFGTSPGVSYPAFTPYLPGSTSALAAGDEESLQPGVNFCPSTSKIAEATIKTPLLPNSLKGFVYLASPQNFASFPQENPFSKHVAMYIVAEDPTSGSLVKLPGKVELGGEPGVEGLAPGQIRSTFEDSPQLPFEDAELHFFGGERAPLVSPNHCGTYTTRATFTPWSGGEPVNSQSSFEITSGPNGSPCPGAALPFTPSLASGTTDNNAGGFSSLTTTMSRPDGDQSIQSVTLRYPAGLSGLLSGVELCPGAQANQGTCAPNSQIGETIVSVGVGGDPFTVTGGKVYITGPYEGAPFGLSIVNPAKAGPFDLQEGRPVVVRAKIEVNPTTAALTITTNTAEQGHAIPTIVEGFPLQIQHVNVLVNRPGFTFNPTSCTPMAVIGSIDSAEGASSPVSVPFQVTNCAVLGFAPKFNVSTSAKTSRLDGASLNVKLAYPSAPFGSQANIREVKVELPKGLPSRLQTLQKACTAAQFHANPAGCPAASIVGHAKAITPLVPVPLEGPAYFVSNGGEAFPNLIVVLQGYGVTIELVGDTFISKAGVTSSTFKTVPDAPVGSFELNLPEGPYSALTTDGNLCKQKLVMPSEFLAQNGAKITQSTKIAVTGCPRKAKKAKKHSSHGRRGKVKAKAGVERGRRNEGRRGQNVRE